MHFISCTIENSAIFLYNSEIFMTNYQEMEVKNSTKQYCWKVMESIQKVTLLKKPANLSLKELFDRKSLVSFSFFIAGREGTTEYIFIVLFYYRILSLSFNLVHYNIQHITIQQL